MERTSHKLTKRDKLGISALIAKGKDLASQYEAAVEQFNARTKPLRDALQATQHDYRQIVIETLREAGHDVADEDFVGVEVDEEGSPVEAYVEREPSEVLSG